MSFQTVRLSAVEVKVRKLNEYSPSASPILNDKKIDFRLHGNDKKEIINESN